MRNQENAQIRKTHNNWTKKMKNSIINWKWENDINPTTWNLAKSTKNQAHSTKNQRKRTDQENPEQSYEEYEKFDHEFKMRRWCKPDNMRVSGEHSEQRNLAKSGGGNTFIVFMETGLLQSHNLTGRFLSRSVHFPISSFSHFLQLLECLHCRFRFLVHFLFFSLQDLWVCVRFAKMGVLFSVCQGAAPIYEQKAVGLQRQHFWISKFFEIQMKFGFDMWNTVMPQRRAFGFGSEMRFFKYLFSIFI